MPLEALSVIVMEIPGQGDQVSPQNLILHVLLTLCGIQMATGRCCTPDEGYRELETGTPVCLP